MLLGGHPGLPRRPFAKTQEPSKLIAKLRKLAQRLPGGLTAVHNVEVYRCHRLQLYHNAIYIDLAQQPEWSKHNGVSNCDIGSDGTHEHRTQAKSPRGLCHVKSATGPSDFMAELRCAQKNKWGCSGFHRLPTYGDFGHEPCFFLRITKLPRSVLGEIAGQR